MISQVLHFYSMSYKGLLSLPIYTFWELSGNINRIQAEKSKIEFNTLAQAIGIAFGNSANEYLNSLDNTQGRVIMYRDANEDKADIKSINKLRVMLGG
jgi:hypothetical protein